MQKIFQKTILGVITFVSLQDLLDNPVYSVINGNFGYWQKTMHIHTPSGGSGGIYPRGTAGRCFGWWVNRHRWRVGLAPCLSIYTNGMVSGYIDGVGGPYLRR